jgi:phage-related minor tail protein
MYTQHIREDAEQLRTELGKREGLLQELLQSQAQYSSEVEQLRAALRDAGADADSGDEELDSTTNDADSDNGSVTPAVRFNGTRYLNLNSCWYDCSVLLSSFELYSVLAGVSALCHFMLS